MNIFGIGPAPFLIVMLALVLFGPKKMVQYAYQAGKYVAQMRAMWEQTMQAVQKEFQEAGLDLPTNTLDQRFDIGAEAMKVINGTPASSTAAPTATPTVSPTAESLPTPPTISQSPAAPSEPSLNVPPEDDQNKKYDAWLPN